MTSVVKLSVLLPVVAWVSSGCGGDDRPDDAPPAGAAEVQAAVRSGPSDLEGSGPWTTQSTGGARVTLAVERVPITAGPLALDITVERDGENIAARSVDLASPTMPVHGVVRFPVEASGGTGSASIEIPMEGRWALYVNLDDGMDSAEFVFDALAVSEQAHAQHAP